jgi:predicted aldo/keto reductase-like oxidoreductase
MERRRLGKNGPEVSVVGLGTEHLERSKETVDAVLRVAVEAGADYVDLLYVEADYWEAFGPVYRAYREHLVLAGHWGSGPRYDIDYCQSTFDNMLVSLGNDRVEVAMMTMIDDGDRKDDAWREASLEALRRYQAQGRVGAIGGSAHDPAVALEAVRSSLLDLLMFPINMLGHDDEPTQALIQACADRGVGLVAMKAYHGGTLLWANGQPTGITPAQCLQYVFSLPVSVAVPGPKTLEEWQATLRAATAPEAERDYQTVLGNLREILAGQCVYCHHCLPCPEEIEIGWVIWHVDHALGGDVAQFREWYAGFPVKASACTECGICLARCPFDVDIMAKLAQAVALFETPAAA